MCVCIGVVRFWYTFFVSSQQHVYFPRAYKSKFAKATTTELFKYEGREEENIQHHRPITQTLKHNFHTHKSRLMERVSKTKNSLKHEHEQFVCHTQLHCVETTMMPTPMTGTYQSVYEQK